MNATNENKKKVMRCFVDVEVRNVRCWPCVLLSFSLPR